jgi:hypothetical protein
MGTQHESPAGAEADRRDTRRQAAPQVRKASRRGRYPRLIAIGATVALALLATVFLVPDRALLAIGAAVVVVLLTAWVLILPRRLAPPVPAEILTELNDHDRLEAINARVKLQNDVRTTALQAIAGLAVLAGAVLGF